jgi:hypothetical protein
MVALFGLCLGLRRENHHQRRLFIGSRNWGYEEKYDECAGMYQCVRYAIIHGCLHIVVSAIGCPRLKMMRDVGASAENVVHRKRDTVES